MYLDVALQELMSLNKLNVPNMYYYLLDKNKQVMLMTLLFSLILSSGHDRFISTF